MSKVKINESDLMNIANAIRTKESSQNTYKPMEMAGAILNLTSGGVKLAESKQELDSLASQDGDLGLVYYDHSYPSKLTVADYWDNEVKAGWNESDKLAIYSIIFPSEVQFSSEPQNIWGALSEENLFYVDDNLANLYANIIITYDVQYVPPAYRPIIMRY